MFKSRRKLFKLQNGDLCLDAFATKEDIELYNNAIKPGLDRVPIHPFGRLSKVMGFFGVKDFENDYIYISRTLVMFINLSINAIGNESVSIANDDQAEYFEGLVDRWYIFVDDYMSFIDRYGVEKIREYEKVLGVSDSKSSIEWLYNRTSANIEGGCFFIDPINYEVPWGYYSITAATKLVIQKAKHFSNIFLTKKENSIYDIHTLINFRAEAKAVVEATYLYTDVIAESVETLSEFKYYIYLNSLKITAIFSLEALDSMLTLALTNMVPYKSSVIPDLSKHDDYSKFATNLSAEGKEMLERFSEELKDKIEDIPEDVRGYSLLMLDNISDFK